jgi:uncharacterized protein
MRLLLHGCICIALLAGWHTLALAEQPARIVLIIDDMGYSTDLGSRALQLPGAITYSFLPFTPAAVQLANAANAKGKEVMLHAPMAAQRGNRLGPGALTPDMGLVEFHAVTQNIIASVPHVRGVNNHMGSELTGQVEPMQWLMADLSQHGLYFVDSRTNPYSVAQKVAAISGIPHLRRDVFLDDDNTPGHIAQQFQLLLARARSQGLAVGIGHPRPATLAMLEKMLPAALAQPDIKLVPASKAVQRGYGPLLTLLTHDRFPTSR